MCRLAAWTGPPRALSALTHDPPHSLQKQSWAPLHMIDARLNADGAGVAWYPDDGERHPVRYRTTLPLWSDENLASLAPRIRSRVAIAVIRSATPGLAVSPASTPPFVHEELTFAHNGFLQGFHRNFMRPMRERLGDEAYATIIGGTDSEHVFALILEQLAGARSTEALVEATKQAVESSKSIARAHGAKAALNLMVSNGQTLIATRFCEGGPAPSLFLRCGEGVTLASEPLDDADWQEVPEGTLVVAGEGGRVERYSL